MKPKKMKREVEQIVREWIGEHRRIIHFWESADKDTYYVVVAGGAELLFLRVFYSNLTGEWNLSEDNSVDLGA